MHITQEAFNTLVEQARTRADELTKSRFGRGRFSKAGPHDDDPCILGYYTIDVDGRSALGRTVDSNPLFAKSKAHPWKLWGHRYMFAPTKLHKSSVVNYWLAEFEKVLLGDATFNGIIQDSYTTGPIIIKTGAGGFCTSVDSKEASRRGHMEYRRLR